MSHLKHLNKTPEQWAKVNPKMVVTGSAAQIENILTDALFDIQKLALEISRLPATPKT